MISIISENTAKMLITVKRSNEMIIDSRIYNGKCVCGREHFMTTELCVIEKGCMSKIEKYLKKCGLFGYSVAVYDENFLDGARQNGV